MKNLYVTIATLLFLNFMTISAIEETHHDKAIAYLSEKWQLNNLQPFTYPSVFNNYIARAYSHRYQHDVVLKICESHDERKALQYLQCDGIVHLLDYDHEHCALLLQHVPSRGCMTDFFLEQDDDDLVINAFVHLFKKIHKSQKILASTNDFKTIHDNFAELRSFRCIKTPQELMQKALQISDQIIASNEPEYLLHSDLHFGNILKTENGFIAIDPWAAVGPLEYEAACFLASPTDLLLLRNDIKEVLQNRLNRLSHLLNLNKKRLKDCAFMRILLLAGLCEIRNKNDDWIDQFIQVAQIIDQLNDDESSFDKSSDLAKTTTDTSTDK